MDLLQLRYFCYAAECENFSETARKFMVPPSDISQMMKRLEKELGVRLFDRNSNKLVLNSCGKLFYGRIKESLRLIDEAVVSLEDSGDKVCGEISLNICTNRRITLEVISSFHEKYPDVSFVISHDSAQLGEFDFLISDNTDVGGDMEKTLLVSEKMYLAVSSRHRLAAEKTVSVKRLSDERFISMPENRSLYNITKKVCREAGFEPEIAICLEDPYYIRKYVEMNMGIAFVPGFSWQGQFGEAVLIETDIGNRNTYLIRKKEKYMTKAMRIFEAMLIGRCREK